MLYIRTNISSGFEYTELTKLNNVVLDPLGLLFPHTSKDIKVLVLLTSHLFSTHYPSYTQQVFYQYHLREGCYSWDHEAHIPEKNGDGFRKYHSY